MIMRSTPGDFTERSQEKHVISTLVKHFYQAVALHGPLEINNVVCDM